MNFRSPQLMNANDTAVVIIDVQQKLIPLIENHPRIIANINRLIAGASILGLKIVATEQYPKGLGATVADVKDKLTAVGVEAIPEKLMFSCRECAEMLSTLAEQGVTKLLLSGIESHVCVAQTALDCLAAGFSVYVCVDAVGSRALIDHQTALRRLENSGVIPTTTEAALFEWCERAGSDKFKAISKLVVG